MLSLTFNRSRRSLSCAWPTPRPNSCGNYLIIKPLNFCFPLYIYLWNYNFIFQHSCQSKPTLIRHRMSCCCRFRASIVCRALTIHLWPGPLAYVVNSFFCISLWCSALLACCGCRLTWCAGAAADDGGSAPIIMLSKRQAAATAAHALVIIDSFTMFIFFIFTYFGFNSLPST